jgi:hypothetical protein
MRAPRREEMFDRELKYTDNQVHMRLLSVLRYQGPKVPHMRLILMECLIPQGLCKARMKILIDQPHLVEPSTTEAANAKTSLI